MPNFGSDATPSETIDSMNSLSLAEKKLGHQWVVTKAVDPYPMNYKVPNFGVDPDILDTIHHYTEAEFRLQGQEIAPVTQETE